MDELHLYHGSKCNRECTFCCVNGAMDGHHTPFTEPVLQAAVRIVGREGSLKIYGGEPTLDVANLKWMVRRLRELGFAGAITIFSNGLRARPLLDILQSDARTYVVLNFSIFTGRGEKPLPAPQRRLLLEFHRATPGRIFLSHDFTVAVGREAAGTQRPEDAHLPCFRCWPTLTSSGAFHACPFAVEYQSPHFDLGSVNTDARTVQENYRHFLDWVDEHLNPQAAHQNIGSCELCTSGNAPAFTPRPVVLTLTYRPRQKNQIVVA